MGKEPTTRELLTRIFVLAFNAYLKLDEAEAAEVSLLVTELNFPGLDLGNRDAKIRRIADLVFPAQPSTITLPQTPQHSSDGVVTHVKYGSQEEAIARVEEVCREKGNEIISRETLPDGSVKLQIKPK